MIKLDLTSFYFSGVVMVMKAIKVNVLCVFVLMVQHV